MAKSNQSFGDMNLSAEQIQMAHNAIRNARDVKCTCGGLVFNQAIKLKQVSSLLSPDGESKLIPVPVVYCIKCLKELNFEEESKPAKDSEETKNPEVITLDFHNKKKD